MFCPESVTLTSVIIRYNTMRYNWLAFNSNVFHKVSTGRQVDGRTAKMHSWMTDRKLLQIGKLENPGKSTFPQQWDTHRLNMVISKKVVIRLVKVNYTFTNLITTFMLHKIDVSYE